MTKFSLLAAGLFGAAAMAVPASAALIGDNYTIVNTFEDANFTGAAETTFFELTGEVTDPGLELDGDDLGLIYDFNIDDGRYEMTLVDNSQVTDTLLPDGRFDRYYVSFDSNIVTDVELDATAELAAFATVEAGTYDMLDIFNVGFDSFTLPNDGFLLTLGPGSDLTALDVMAAVNFTTVPVPEPSTMALAGLGVAACVARRRR